MRDLVPKLQPRTNVSDTGPFVPPPEARELLMSQPVAAEVPEPAPRTAPDDYLRKHYETIVATLDDTNPTVDARKVALQPEVFSLGLAPHEIIAYRRLFGGVECDRELEEFYSGLWLMVYCS